MQYQDNEVLKGCGRINLTKATYRYILLEFLAHGYLATGQIKLTKAPMDTVCQCSKPTAPL